MSRPSKITRPPRRLEQAADGVERGRFARAVRANQADDLPLLDRETTARAAP